MHIIGDFFLLPGRMSSQVFPFYVTVNGNTCNLISFGFMSATDFENESLNYFSNKYPNLACAWTTGEEKWGLTAVQL